MKSRVRELQPVDNDGTAQRRGTTRTHGTEEPGTAQNSAARHRKTPHGTKEHTKHTPDWHGAGRNDITQHDMACRRVLRKSDLVLHSCPPGAKELEEPVCSETQNCSLLRLAPCRGGSLSFAGDCSVKDSRLPRLTSHRFVKTRAKTTSPLWWLDLLLTVHCLVRID